MRVTMFQTDERPRRANLDTQFLTQLARQSSHTLFTGFKLAARKLPGTSQMFAGRPLRNEYPACGIDHDAADHMQRCARHSRARFIHET